MSVSVSIFDDPAATEGGRATMRFLGATTNSPDDVLTIEVLTDGVDYAGPKRIPVAVIPVSDGVEVSVVPELINSMPPDVSVAVGLQNAGVAADVIWPALTPARKKKRNTIRTRMPREVVDEGHIPPINDKPLVENNTAEPVVMLEQPYADKIVIRQEKNVHTNKQNSETTNARLEATTQVNEMAKERKSRLQAIGMSVLAFIAGAISVMAVWWLHAAPQAHSVASETPLPSPYAIFDGLPERSPTGIAVTQDVRELVKMGRGSTDPKEKAFWIDWAVRRMLMSRETGIAGILSDFASSIANDTSLPMPGRLSSAQFLWEMAAAAGDCGAMDNIAVSKEMLGEPSAASVDLAVEWQARAKQCHMRNP